MASLSEFNVGYCTHPACMALNGAGLGSRCFPARAYLIQGRQGLYLWDTGYASHFLDAAQGIYRLYTLVTPVHLEEQEPLIRQLHARGVHANDLDAIVVSHFHADHIAGLKDFPGVRIICAREAWESIRLLRGIRALRKAFLPGLVPGDMTERLVFDDQLERAPLPGELHPFTHGYALDAAGEIFLVALPGHAAGQLGAFVRTDRGWILLASDSAWAPENYTELRGPSELSFLVQHNRSSYYQTLRKLQQLHSSGVDIRLTHQQSPPESA